MKNQTPTPASLLAWRSVSRVSAPRSLPARSMKEIFPCSYGSRSKITTHLLLLSSVAFDCRRVVLCLLKPLLLRHVQTTGQ